MKKYFSTRARSVHHEQSRNIQLLRLAQRAVHWVRALGADRVIDRVYEDVREDLQRYDVVFDAVGLSSYRRFRRVIAPGGIYLSTVPSLALILRLPWWGSHRARVAFTGLRATSQQSEETSVRWRSLLLEARFSPSSERAFLLSSSLKRIGSLTPDANEGLRFW